MIRRLFTVAAAISLLLCVGSAALWVRSYVTSDWITYCRDLGGHRQRDFNASADSSWVVVGFGRTKLGWRWLRQEPERVTEEMIDASSGSLPAQVRVPGLRVRWTRRVVGPGDTIWSFVIVARLWILFLLSAILPTTWRLLRFAARRRTHAPNRCTHCGYDLRASNDRCPECGMPIRLNTAAKV